MSHTETVNIITNQSEEIDDKDLATLDDEVRAEEARAGRGTTEIEDLDPDEPYQMEVAKPRAIDLKKLYKLAKKPVPNDIKAALGSQIPVLIYHGFTPFHKAGANPTGVWGMGYEMRLKGLDEADTVSVMPSSETVERGKFTGKVDMGLSVGGEIKAVPTTTKILDKIPGFSLHKAEVNMTTDNHLSLSIALVFSALKIQSGPVGSGGAKWNIYRQEKRIDVFQPLLQTLLVPEGTDRLQMIVQTWIRRRGRFFGLMGSRAWKFTPVKYKVSLAGL